MNTKPWPVEAHIASFSEEANASRKKSLRLYHESKWSKRLRPNNQLLCTKCKKPKSLSEFKVRGTRPTGHCTSCRKQWSSNGYASKRTSKLKTRYGITDQQYESLLSEQNGTCAICKGPPTGISKINRFYVDHDHKTNAVRGLLCFHCNTLLGCAKDNTTTLASAIGYLARQENVD